MHAVSNQLSDDTDSDALHGKQVKEDGSCLVLQQHGRFCLHYPPGAAEPRTYAIEAVPEQVWKLNRRDRLMLGPIARRAAMHW